MREGILRKGLIVGIIVLFVGTNIGSCFYTNPPNEINQLIKITNSNQKNTVLNRQTIIIQPSIQDSFVDRDEPNVNFGDCNWLSIEPTVTYGANEFVYIQFDLSSIPPGSTINSAQLQVYCSWVDPPVSVTVYEVMSPWGEMTVTWNNGPLWYTTPSSQQSINSGGWKSWNVTAHVNDWLNGVHTNYGFTMIDNTYITRYAEFYPKEYAVSTLRPRLVINLTNLPPLFGSPTPSNGSTNNPRSFAWGIPINDPEGDSFSWTIQCNNGQSNYGDDASNGTKYLSLSGLAYSTSYKVWVNATDLDGSTLFTRGWYTFTTKTSLPPDFGLPNPENGSTNQPLSLIWSIPINDPDGDLISWTIQCSNGQTNSAIESTNGTKTLSLTNLVSSTTYKVWVNATDPGGSGLYTRKWCIFTTQQQQNAPPNKPNRPSGPTSGKINVQYTYTTSTIDSNGDQVYYQWDWGDATYSAWLGPFESDATATASHTWSTQGSYNIRVKAKDTYDVESPWSDPLTSTMPESNAYPFHLFFIQILQKFFERYPNAFLSLHHLIGY
jgi:hypothetical protein